MPKLGILTSPIQLKCIISNCTTMDKRKKDSDKGMDVKESMKLLHTCTVVYSLCILVMFLCSYCVIFCKAKSNLNSCLNARHNLIKVFVGLGKNGVLN